MRLGAGVLGLFLVGPLVAALSGFGCGKKDPSASGEPSSRASVSSAGVEAPIPASSAGDAGAKPTMVALAQITPVYSDSEFPPKDPLKASEARQGVVQLGHLRRGAIIPVKPNLIKKGNCPEGWYALESGGFVCGKYLTNDPNARDLRGPPHPPFADRPLPYDYGLNLTNGAPLYYRVPKKSERDDAEKGLAVGRGKKQGDEGGGADSPWYMKKHEGGRPMVSLGDLKGESSLIVIRMVRGFYVAIGDEAKSAAGKFWRTTDGLIAAQDHLLVHQSKTEFEGVRLNAPEEKRKLPLAFVLGLHAKQYFFKGDDPDKKPGRGEHIDRFSIVGLTGQRKLFEQQAYLETTDGYYVRAVDVTTTKPGPPPPGLKPGEKWIDVNLKTQSLVAFEGEIPVYATIVSTGRHNDEDPSKDHRTKPGDFRVASKFISTTMDDDGASDGPYSIQDVPWTMYFNGSTALHGAFWHSSFGHERSHGCVNMTPFDAKNIFQWVGPVIPPGWHGVKATNDNAGTRIIVHLE